MKVSHIQDDDEVSREWRDSTQTPCDGGSRRSRSPTGREWVVRRRSDGSRYIGRRRSSAGAGKHLGDTDCARQSRPRPSPHRPPADYNHQHGHDALERNVEDYAIHSPLDQLTDMDHGDYRAAEWICSPHWIDSGYRIFAVI